MMVITYALILCTGAVVWPTVSPNKIDRVCCCIKQSTNTAKMPSDRFWNAIQQVETGGEDDPETAIGDRGASIGPLQIQRGYYSDAIIKDPSLQSGQYCGYTYDNCKGPGSFEYSKKVGNAYMARYAIEKRLGHIPTDEDFARIHNGGPNGWKRDATLEYWHKVQAVLNSQ